MSDTARDDDETGLLGTVRDGAARAARTGALVGLGTAGLAAQGAQWIAGGHTALAGVAGTVATGVAGFGAALPSKAVTNAGLAAAATASPHHELSRGPGGRVFGEHGVQRTGEERGYEVHARPWRGAEEVVADVRDGAFDSRARAAAAAAGAAVAATGEVGARASEAILEGTSLSMLLAEGGMDMIRSSEGHGSFLGTVRAKAANVPERLGESADRLENVARTGSSDGDRGPEPTPLSPFSPDADAPDPGVNATDVADAPDDTIVGTVERSEAPRHEVGGGRDAGDDEAAVSPER